MKTLRLTLPSSVINVINTLVALLVAVVALSSVELRGQLLQQSTTPDVERLEIQFEGVENVSREAVLAHIRLRVGQPYSQSLVDQSIRALYASGNFDFIEVRRQNLPSGNVAVYFIVVPKYRISSITFKGNENYSDSRLLDKIESQVGGPLDDVILNRDATKIYKYYQEKGYTNVRVGYDVVRDDKKGTGAVTFDIHEGERLKIDNILFRGNENISASKLRDQMKTTEYIPIWSWIAGTGRLEEDVFEDDLEKLRAYYRNQGFLDVEIPESEVVLEYPKPGNMDIVITVHEGRRYYVGNVTIEGNKLYSTEKLTSLLTIGPGSIFSPTEVDRNAERIKDFYGEGGYLDTYVRVERVPNIEKGVIDLRFIITESERFYVQTINLQGNTKTKNQVIVRELALAPGDVFDTVRMRASQGRLVNTRFFDDVILSPEATNVPNRRNLRISVKEGRTGNVTFGAGFSTVEQVVAFAELSQSNFDLFNYRSLFQGGGQKFRLRFALGTRSNQILLAFEEPWLFQRELALGFEIYRTETDYLSSDYNELRQGFEIYFRKRLFELVEGRLSYRLEEVEIRDVVASAPSVIKSEEGKRSVSKVGFSLLRDTRDNLVFPTRGTRLQSITEVAGGPFMGQTNYVRQEFRAGTWIKVFDTAEQVLSVQARTGTVIPYGGRTVPFFDKYFLGGPYSLRGFKFREVGPKDPATGEAIGGETMAMAQIEYTIKIVDPLRFAIFYDIGFVNSGDMNWSTTSYNDDVGFGFRVLIMGAPLNLDFGYPLRTDRYNDKGLQFNFSFGTVF